MKTRLTCFLILSSSFLFGQQLEKDVVTPGGGFANAPESNINIHWSLGEVATTILQEAEINLSQGFHQLDILVDPVFYWPQGRMLVNIFPNPTSDVLVLQQETSEIFNVRLSDMYGKVIYQHQWATPEHRIDLSELPDQAYALILSANSSVQSFKILKQR